MAMAHDLLVTVEENVIAGARAPPAPSPGALKLAPAMLHWPAGQIHRPWRPAKLLSLQGLDCGGIPGLISRRLQQCRSGLEKTA